MAYNFDDKIANKMLVHRISKLELDAIEPDGRARLSITKDNETYLIWVRAGNFEKVDFETFIK